MAAGRQAQTFAALCRSDDGKSITCASKLRRAGSGGTAAAAVCGGKSPWRLQCAIRGNLSSLMPTPGSPGGSSEAKRGL